MYGRFVQTDATFVRRNPERKFEAWRKEVGVGRNPFCLPVVVVFKACPLKDCGYGNFSVDGMY